LELLVFNLANGQVRKIYTGQISEIDWGAKDWILFLTKNSGSLDRRIYKIRPSGDSLTLFQSDSLLISHISWNKAGDKFIYVSSSPSPSSDYYPLTMADVEGNTLKQSFDHSSFDLEWHHEPYMTQAFHYYESSFSINIYDHERLFDDPNNSKITEFNISSFDFGFGRQIDWLDDQTMLVSLTTGLYSIALSDLSNPGEPVLIMANECPQHAGISNFTVHRASKKVIALYTELEKVGEEVVRNYKILRMNGDGSGVEFFEIPE
jgi:hypothetical protein